MTTLKQLWEDKRLSPTEVAGKAGVSIPTLYRIARKEPVRKSFKGQVRESLILRVCTVLGISMQEYEELDPSS